MDKKTVDFFNSIPSIRDIAFKCKEKLLEEKYFSSRSKVFFLYDMDVMSRKEFVWIIVKVNKSYEEAYGILDDFDKDWWIAQLPLCKGKLSISIRAKEEY